MKALAFSFLILIVSGLLLFVYVVGPNPVWYLVSMRSYALTSLALKAGFSPNECKNNGHECPLLIAAIFSDMRMISILEKHGANVHILNSAKENVLNVSCENVEILKHFIAKRVNLNNQSVLKGLPGFTPLHCAVLNNAVESVKLLISNQADQSIGIADWAGKKNVTPLQLAQSKNLKDLIPLLTSQPPPRPPQ